MTNTTPSGQQSGHTAMTSSPTSAKEAGVLTELQSELLTYLCTVPGADVWERWDAKTCRELEPLGLVRIVKAKNAPSNGALRQPFFGVKATAAGRKLIKSRATAPSPLAGGAS